MNKNKSESPEELSPDVLDEMFRDTNPTLDSDAISELQQSVEEEKDKRREERFLWICAILVIFDVDAFGDMQGWSGPIVLGIIQLLFLIVAGRYYGVDEIYTFTMRCFEKINLKINK